MAQPTVPQHDTQAWLFQVWVAFLISFATTAFGILRLPVDNWIRALLWMGLSFTVTSAFSLAKTIRDNHEAWRLRNRITDAKPEKLLRDYEMKAETE